MLVQKSGQVHVSSATVEKPKQHAAAESSSVSSPSLTESLIDVNKTYTNLTQHSFARHYSRSLGSPVSKRASSEKGVFSISVECIGTKHDRITTHLLFAISFIIFIHSSSNPLPTRESGNPRYPNRHFKFFRAIYRAKPASQEVNNVTEFTQRSRELPRSRKNQN